MSFSNLVARWQGLVLSVIGVVATVWLGFSGQLGLYIHPRYYVFTLIMAAIAVVLIVGAFASVTRAGAGAGSGAGAGDDGHGHGHGGSEDAHEHLDGHEDGHGHPATGRRWSFVTAGLTVVLVGAAVVALLAVPPSTLTSSTVEQRSLNAAASTLSNVGGGAGSGTGSGAAAGGDTSAYTVKDWSTLIRQGAGPDALAGQTATLVGFVTPDPDDPTNVFYIARFVVTCCAVDAQPVGVAVYEPGWSGTYAKDSWVSATGVFASNPSVLSTATTVLQPTSIQAIAQPTEPYVY